MEQETSRRQFMRKGAKYGGTVLATSAVAGCPLGPSAPELRDAVEAAERQLQSELPWNTYDLEFQVDRLETDLARFGRTGVENAYQYGVTVEVPMSRRSNDLRGFTRNPEAEEEFFALYAPPSFDMLLETYDNLQEFTVPNQPSHRNQIVQYTLHIGGEGCSYLEDTIPGSRMADILASPQAYLEYLAGGEAVEVVLDDGFLGLGWFC